jgi:hypothetical protein
MGEWKNSTGMFVLSEIVVLDLIPAPIDRLFVILFACYHRQPDRDDIINIVHDMYTKNGISFEDVSRIVDTFPNQGIVPS